MSPEDVNGCRKQMSVIQFNKRRTKSLASWLVMLLTPGLLMLVPVVNIFTLPVWVLWITIPAIPLTILGIRSYEFQEFGAMPKGIVDWACIVSFYIFTAFFLSWRTHRNLQRALREELQHKGVPICLGCGYDLRGQAESRCSECGRSFPAGLLRHDLPVTDSDRS